MRGLAEGISAIASLFWIYRVIGLNKAANKDRHIRAYATQCPDIGNTCHLD